MAWAAEAYYKLYLTHVLPSIFCLDVTNVKRPGVFVIVGDLQTVVVCDDMVMDGQNGLRVGLYPRNL